MTGKTVFNYLNGKLILENDAIIIEQSLVHKFNNLTQFSRVPARIPLEDIHSVEDESP